MSFRDNLQHMRAARNMTQSQLAMLLGVSRQSVAKWEAEKSYPEMDKLLKICDIFECTLDELVRGDLTGREAKPALVVPEDAPPVDVCGYDEHMRRRAWRVPTGVAAIMLGFGAASLVAIAVAHMHGLQGVLDFATYCAGAVAGLALLVPAAIEHRAFKREHPYVEDFYTAAQKAQARRWKSRGIVGGIALVLVALFAPALANAVDANWLAASAFWTCLAAGIALIAFGVMTGRLVEVERYNRIAERTIGAAADLVRRVDQAPSATEASATVVPTTDTGASASVEALAPDAGEARHE